MPNVKRVLKSRLFENFLSLGIIQGLNYLLPLITIPFLYNQLGVENYGLVNFSFAFIQYFIIITDFGFGLSGTRYVAANRDDKVKINRFLNSACLARMGFCSLSFLVLLVCLFAIPAFQKHKFFTILFFGQVVGNSINPVWFFQGMEKMKFNTIVNITTRLISILPLFVVVRKPEDCIYIPICYSTGSIVAGFLSLYLIKREFGMKYFVTTWKEVKETTIDSSRYFLSRISVSLYTNTNSFVLGLVCGNTAVGYYSLAEKIYVALNSIYGPINGTIFPYMTKEGNLPLFKKIIGWGTILNAMMIVVFFFVFPLICPFIIPEFSQQSYKVLDIFLFANIMSLPATFLGYPFLAAWGHPNFTNYSLVFTSLFHVSGLLILLAFGAISIYTVAMMVAICEFLLLAIRLWGSIKYNLWKE